MRTHFLESFVVYETSSILGDFELALLYLLAELPFRDVSYMYA